MWPAAFCASNPREKATFWGLAPRAQTGLHEPARVFVRVAAADRVAEDPDLDVGLPGRAELPGEASELLVFDLDGGGDHGWVTRWTEETLPTSSGATIWQYIAP